MSNHAKLQPNDPCPCWSGKKFKRCCRGVVDWTQIFRTKQDQRPYMSIRGRNILFATAIVDALGLDPSERPSLQTYKKAFTAPAVRKIYEAIMGIWPPNSRIQSLLERSGADVSGLYIGDYAREYVERAVVRHSIYANKILLVDPFMHPYVAADTFNPILHPEEFRAQTLRNVNFYFSMLPWIDQGIVEFIRTPADFDRQLNWDAIQRASRLKEVPEITAAAEADFANLKDRHFERRSFDFAVLSPPDAHLRRLFRQLNPSGAPITEDQFIAHINKLRDRDPDFLEPLGTGEQNGRFEVYFAGHI